MFIITIKSTCLHCQVISRWHLKYSCSSSVVKFCELVYQGCHNCTKFVTGFLPTNYYLWLMIQDVGRKTTVHFLMLQNFAQEIASPFPIVEGQGIIDFHVTQNILL